MTLRRLCVDMLGRHGVCNGLYLQRNDGVYSHE